VNDSYNSALETILKNRLAGIPQMAGQVHPFYNGLSIANIPASVCGWLDSPLPGSLPLDDVILKNFEKSYQHVVLVIVDGLGLNFLKTFHLESANNNPLPEWKSMLADGTTMPLTSIAPSTTSAALTTLWTGRLPVEHGIIGYELFLKEFGFIANMITHSVAAFIGESGNIQKAGFDPDSFIPVSTNGDHFKKTGVKSFALQHQSIAGSGLSRMLLRNAQPLSFDSLAGMWQQVLNIHESYRGEKTYTYIYWGEMDTISHHVGPVSMELYQLWKTFIHWLVKFVRDYRKSHHVKTLFLLTADHGQIPTSINPDFDLHHHPRLTEHLIMMPSGEGRLPFLFIKPNHEEAIRDYLSSHWAGQFEMCPSEDVLASGLLGGQTPYQGTIDRLGQYMIFPKSNGYWWWVNKENHLLGRHGGLSQEEMLVPFIALEL